MAIRGGYQGKFLEVDLTEGKFGAVPLPEEAVLRRWVGCTGLGLHLLAQEVTPDMKPTDPECPVFIMAGPLTGTLVPSSANWTIVSIHGMIPYHVGISQSHGYWGARLKHAGWDGIIVRGTSPRPVYLWIDNDRVELRDAQRYWGQDVSETTRLIQTDHGDLDNISVACIGPGGENLLPGASVRSDLAFGANKGGPGIIWGAKKLKAIAVRGTGKVLIAHPEAMQEVCEEWKRLLEALPFPMTPAGVKNNMLNRMVRNMESGREAGKNLTDPVYAAIWGKRLARDMAQWKIKEVTSWQCDFSCHSETTVTTGPMAGYVFVGAPGTVLGNMGPYLGVDDPGVAIALCGMVDGLGLDCCELPEIIAMVMEAYNKGVLTLEDTDGIDLSWNNYEAVMELLDKTVRREGIGATLAKGMRSAAKELGIEEMAVHIKGVGGVEHDPRSSGIPHTLQYIMSGAGPTRQLMLAAYGSAGWPDLGIEPMPDFEDPEGMDEFTYKALTMKMWGDTLGVCLRAFNANMRGILDVMARALRAATGWEDFIRDETLLTGERVVNLQRLISLYRGYKPEYDFDFSPRLVEPIAAGPAKGVTGIGRNFTALRQAYYDRLQWDPYTGWPRPETLERLGLSGYRVGRV